jgi:hypothetical protein
LLEQETASIIKFVLDNSDNPNPYYYRVPQSFFYPAAYFPTPEINTRGETFRTYAASYTWFIKFFGKTTEAAYERALLALAAIKRARNLIPLIGADGNPTGDGIRAKDPSLNTIDDGAVQLKIEWDSRRPYDDRDCLKMQTYRIEGWSRPDIYLEREIPAAALAEAERYIADCPDPERAGEYPSE